MFQGAGLLVVDTSVDEFSEGKFYLTESPDGLTLLGGDHVQQSEAVASVLFLARPPLREVGMPTAEVLQL